MTFCSLISALALVGFMHSQDSSAPATPVQPATKSPTVEEVIQSQLPSYPLSKCPISGEALGSMGDPIDFVHGTRLVRFCCKSCVKSFEKDPAPAMKQIDDALIEAQKKTYGTDQCVVSDEPLTAQGEPIDFLYGTRLVRFCCKGCIKEFRKDPAKYLTALEAARKTSDPAKKQG